VSRREDVYDNEIAPLMTKIIEVAKRAKIPMFATFQYTEPDEEAGFCTTSIPFTNETDEALLRLQRAWDRERRGGQVMLAETRVTNPDGSTHISIRRVT